MTKHSYGIDAAGKMIPNLLVLKNVSWLPCEKDKEIIQFHGSNFDSVDKKMSYTGIYFFKSRIDILISSFIQSLKAANAYDSHILILFLQLVLLFNNVHVHICYEY